jgi:DNA-binding XRE family transcriptional regulator
MQRVLCLLLAPRESHCTSATSGAAAGAELSFAWDWSSTLAQSVLLLLKLESAIAACGRWRVFDTALGAGFTHAVSAKVFCQNAFCRRLYNISPTIGWVQSAAEFQKRLGVRIRELRTSRGFSQESFAEACDLHRTHGSLLERGRINVTVNTTRQVAHVLQITLSELFRGLN